LESQHRNPVSVDRRLPLALAEHRVPEVEVMTAREGQETDGGSPAILIDAWWVNAASREIGVIDERSGVETLLESASRSSDFAQSTNALHPTSAESSVWPLEAYACPSSARQSAGPSSRTTIPPGQEKVYRQ
jgi:hypothetical protein